MSMGWYYCWECACYRKWHDVATTLDCNHAVTQKHPPYEFNSDDQYEIWAENHDPSAPEIDVNMRINPPGYAQWMADWDLWRKTIREQALAPPLTTRNR